MNTIPALPEQDETINALMQAVGFERAIETMQTAVNECRPLTDAERETVCRSLCRFAGILLDASRMAEQSGEEPETIRRAESAADELINIVNRLNGWGVEDKPNNVSLSSL